MDWRQPEPAAARKLILLALGCAGGTLEGDDGVVDELCALIGIKNTGAVRSLFTSALAGMEQERLINCQGAPGHEPTRLALITQMSDTMMDALASTEEADRSTLTSATEHTAWQSNEEYAALVGRCTKAYAAIQAIADISERNSEGYVAMNVTGALRAVGLFWAHGQEARYYLKTMGLAASIRPCEDASRMLWWWNIASKDHVLDPVELVGLASSPETRHNPDHKDTENVNQ